MHTNCLELKAATLAVQTFLKDHRGVSVLLELDNQTAVAYNTYTIEEGYSVSLADSSGEVSVCSGYSAGTCFCQLSTFLGKPIA